MPAPKGNQNAKGNRGGRGGPTKYRAAFVDQARKACEAGFTDRELADLFGVAETTINAWKLQHVEFAEALKAGKSAADDRVERSLYHKAVGYTFDAVKIFMPAGAERPVYAPYREHVPPSDTACIFWLKNRRRNDWRDKQELTGPDGGPLQIADNRDRIAAEFLRFLERARPCFAKPVIDGEAEEV